MIAQNTEIPKMKKFLIPNAVLITLLMESKDRGKEEEQKSSFLCPFQKTKPKQIKVYVVLNLVAFDSSYQLLCAIQNGGR